MRVFIFGGFLFGKSDKLNFRFAKYAQIYKEKNPLQMPVW